jgi:bifunctional UDP-N-acetylglucosamine pyrophosphorylase/glucosamine-1-phosphate N-acetyltransferase
VILAAGEGKRMHSALPKVLQLLGGRPLLSHLMDTTRELEADAVHVVYGSAPRRVMEAMADYPEINWVMQADRMGTGHAVIQALPDIPDEAMVLVLYGDHPLVPADVLQQLISRARTAMTLLTINLQQPRGYGRILRDRLGRITGIVEEKDATANERRITEVNTGIMLVHAPALKVWLGVIDNDNAQGEYYLTDIVGLAHNDEISIEAVIAPHSADLMGANDRVQLAALERRYQHKAVRALMRSGTSVADPDRVDLRGKLETGNDVFIDINCVFEGSNSLADGCRVGPGCVLKDCSIGAGTVIKAYSVLEGVACGANCEIGPFARLRPDTQLADSVRVGNFVEVKKTTLGEGSKASHLSYLGDSTIGSSVNIGAGTITCNYDGANKYQTIIGDGAFIGSDTQFVAPVSVGKNATIGAGSTITKDVADDELAVSRAKQKNVSGWQRPVKKEDDS